MADASLNHQPGLAGRRTTLAPGAPLKALVLALLVALFVLPLFSTVLLTLRPDTVVAWSDVLASKLAPNLFWWPLSNTLIIGFVVAGACVLLGGFLAWLVVMTDVPFRKTIGVMATLPFMIPSFATALAWGSLFRNDRVGGQVGWLQGIGLDVPDWLAWGMVPTLIVLALHYFSLAVTIIAASLATVKSDLVEAAQIADRRDEGAAYPYGDRLASHHPSFGRCRQPVLCRCRLELRSPRASWPAGPEADAVHPAFRDDRGRADRTGLCDRSPPGPCLGLPSLDRQPGDFRPQVLCHDHRQGRPRQTVQAAPGALAAGCRSLCDPVSFDDCPRHRPLRLQLRALLLGALFRLDAALLDGPRGRIDRRRQARHRPQPRYRAIRLDHPWAWRRRGLYRHGHRTSGLLHRRPLRRRGAVGRHHPDQLPAASRARHRLWRSLYRLSWPPVRASADPLYRCRNPGLFATAPSSFW